MRLSKMLINIKQVSSDVTNIIPVTLDKELVKPAIKRTPIYEELKKFEPAESTYTWPVETADNYGKFVTEATAASAFAAQKGTYGTAGSVATKLMTYVLNIGMVAQKNTRNLVNLVREEQQKGIESMRKGIERCLITGHPATAASDGSAGDSNAFQGLGDLVTTNVYAPTSAEAISLDKVDDAMNDCLDAGASESDLIAITDSHTMTRFSSLYYNTINSQLERVEVAAGLKVKSYNQMPFFVSDFAPTGANIRKMFILDKNTTTIPEFYGINQLDLGRTTLSDDSIMFWMGALAVKKETRNAIITKIAD